MAPGAGMDQGTTSACAENTCCTNLMWTNTRNYLRVRGEYGGCETRHSLISELPPRARRIHQQSDSTADPIGTTSACAENTRGKRCDERFIGNYLRVRGEYKPYQYGGTGNPELPPRARRIRVTGGVDLNIIGTTSACAENTNLF